MDDNASSSSISIDTNSAEAQVLLETMALNVGREIKVTLNNKAAVETVDVNLTSSQSQEEEPDDFYEFTQEDYARLMASKKPELHLKTKKIRDAEAAARRARISKAIIRVEFPDNYILETIFQASDSISLLVDLLRKVIAKPDVPFYLYTTPPKQKLQNLERDFYTAGLAPGALVHFSYDITKAFLVQPSVVDSAILLPEATVMPGTTEPELEEIIGGPYLKADVIALCNLHLLIKPQAEVEKPEDISAKNPSQVRADQNAASKLRKTGPKPKWMKLR